MIEAGVAKVGFPDSNAVTFTLLSAGASNPGNFVLFNTSTPNQIRLSASGATVGTDSSFQLSQSHLHWNWGFSAPGTYTFNIQASYTDPVAGLLQSPVETYTFNVVPEPSTGVLLMAGLATLSAVRRRTRR